MRYQGIKELTVVSEVDEVRGVPGFADHLQAEEVTRFSLSYPDMNCWLLRMAKFLQANNISMLKSKLQYDGPIELLSMWLCLYTAEWDWNIDDLDGEGVSAWAARVRLLMSGMGSRLIRLRSAWTVDWLDESDVSVVQVEQRTHGSPSFAQVEQRTHT